MNNTDLTLLANEYDLDFDVIKAVVTVESLGEGFDKTGYPKILFEGHWFHKFTKGKFDKTNPTISYKRWTTKYYNMSQKKRLTEAYRLDADAALMSTSWGLGQVMGFNYKLVGYTTVDLFAQAMFENEYLQAKAMFDYIKNTGLLEPLKRITKELDKDERIIHWRKFAYSYNGSGYEKNNYHNKLDDAFIR